jgi:hypothetical protein
MLAACRRAAPRTNRSRIARGQRLRKKIGLIVRQRISISTADHTMAMTATERSRAPGERRAGGKIVLTVVVSEDELAAIVVPIA